MSASMPSSSSFCSDYKYGCCGVGGPAFAILSVPTYELMMVVGHIDLLCNDLRSFVPPYVALQ